MRLSDSPQTAEENAAQAELASLRLLTAIDAAKLMAISPRTLYRLAMSGELPHVRLRSAVRFRPADVAAWIGRNVR